MNPNDEKIADSRDQRLAELLETLGEYAVQGRAFLSAFHERAVREIDDRLAILSDKVGEVGVDPFGMAPDTLRRLAMGAAFLYRVYFRCESTGLEHMPEGPVILVANHAGQLPIDGIMITTAMLLECSPPRLARPIADKWIATLPFVSTMMSRMGVVVGSPENAERLLHRGEALLVFPEGMDAITKTVEYAYQLREFGHGFMRIALQQKVPVVPVAVVGSEEQYPTLYNLKRLGQVFGLPSLPIWVQMPVPVLGMLPLPVKYRLAFGAPMMFEGDPDDEDKSIREKVEQVRGQLQQLLSETRRKRRSVFY
ncbi:MAG: acyltransferase family protein [Myxococcota bacterium]|nr:acyltransferase family protein [Myxococcota bacterium]